jgi:hypothetical protein
MRNISLLMRAWSHLLLSKTLPNKKFPNILNNKGRARMPTPQDIHMKHIWHKRQKEV